MAITNVVANAQLLSAIFSVPSSGYYDDMPSIGGPSEICSDLRVTPWKNGRWIYIFAAFPWPV